jgi:hypothetical protein
MTIVARLNITNITNITSGHTKLPFRKQDPQVSAFQVAIFGNIGQYHKCATLLIKSTQSSLADSRLLS